MSQTATDNAWDSQTLANPHTLADKNHRVEQMFSDIAAGYDRANHWLSFNLDHGWRRKAAELAGPNPGESLLDICCGTGDLALAIWERQKSLEQVVGVDFCEAMLAEASRKTAQERYKELNVQWLKADAQRIPLPGASFDIVSCAFGIRNLQDPKAGLAEAFRLLKPGGRIVILEFSRPEGIIFGNLYKGYFHYVLPILGRLIAGGGKAYHYLPRSVASFRTRETIAQGLGDSGFTNISIHRLSLSAVSAFGAEKETASVLAEDFKV